MPRILLKTHEIHSFDDDAVRWIVIEGGRIREIRDSKPQIGDYSLIDLANSTVFPGFIDIHTHGGVGVDVNEANVEGLLKIAGFLARNGVTAWMPTLVPDSDEKYRSIIDAIDELMSIQAGKAVAQAVGVHYEGVFASAAMCGALRPEFFKTGWSAETFRSSGTASPLNEAEIIKLPRLKTGVHMTTVAPEVDGGIELISELVKQGWIVSIGHTKADVETLDRAFTAGARHLTHFFNAMTGMHHREIGVAGWGLANGAATFDIIADGVHVHPDMLGFACRAKTPEKVLLISDSVAPAGLGDGEFLLWGETVSVKDGRTRNERGSIAGSVITMNDAVKVMRAIGFSDAELARMASTNPAKLLGIDDSRGLIEAGKRADLTAVDSDGKIAFTMIGGEIVE